ncbi:MAG TPA: protein kinase [Polyangiaceae bacterium]|nr:protein kinase [Polyangiaceae bacterium]
MALSAAEGPPVAPGDVLAGKYRVERVLGAGGMGVVVAALHLELDERVAVKFLLPEVSQDSNAAARFIREARAAARIKSEHVARVIDVGRLESGAPYMVMEYLEGSDLESLVSQGPLPIEDAVDYVIQACHAMAEAHGVGIVHRDLKPANLFVCQRPDGTRGVKVLDFGISKTTDTGEANLTRTSTMMGSPLYMSPEQMRSARDVDRRTDIWALGAILYQLFSGRTPFHGETLPELVSAILTDDPAPLCNARPELPRELEAIVMRCLRKTPSARFDHVGELVHALTPFGSRRSRYTAERVAISFGTEPAAASLAPKVPELQATLGVGGQTATAWAETSGEERRHLNRRKWLILGSAGLGVVAAFVLLLSPLLRSHASEPAPQTSRSSSTVLRADSAPLLEADSTRRPASTTAKNESGTSNAEANSNSPSNAQPAPDITPMPAGASTVTPNSTGASTNAGNTSPPSNVAVKPAAGAPAGATRSNGARAPSTKPAPVVAKAPEVVAPKPPAPAEPAPKKNPLAIELK